MLKGKITHEHYRYSISDIVKRKLLHSLDFLINELGIMILPNDNFTNSFAPRDAMNVVDLKLYDRLYNDIWYTNIEEDTYKSLSKRLLLKALGEGRLKSGILLMYNAHRCDIKFYSHEIIKSEEGMHIMQYLLDYCRVDVYRHSSFDYIIENTY